MGDDSDLLRRRFCIDPKIVDVVGFPENMPIVDFPFGAGVIGIGPR